MYVSPLATQTNKENTVEGFRVPGTKIRQCFSKFEVDELKNTVHEVGLSSTRSLCSMYKPFFAHPGKRREHKLKSEPLLWTKSLFRRRGLISKR